jgi:Ca2+-binding EF-hand superfamily protein
LRNKLAMKCPPASDEKAFLAKTFKFFDIQNKGSVTQEQFVRSCEKLGVVFPDPDVSSAWLISLAESYASLQVLR